MWIRQLVIVILKTYKRFVSPWLPPACRFVPTCSEYSRGSFERFGLFRAVSLTLARLCRCHPFHPGGVDSVPERRERS